MTKADASQLAYNLVLETVKVNAVWHQTGSPKETSKGRAEYLTELHKALTAYFETVPGPSGS